MKNCIMLVQTKTNNYEVQNSFSLQGGFSLLWLFFVDAHVDYYIQTVKEDSWDDLYSEFVDMRCCKVNDAFIMSYCKGPFPNEDGFWTLKFSVFKNMIIDWLLLAEKGSPEVYIIQKDDDSIVVQETLEGV